MALEANVVYLDEELKNNRERLELMAQFLKENHSISVYKREIRGNSYYYKKYWKDGKSVSEFLCKDEVQYQKHLLEIKTLNKKRQSVKLQYKKLQQVTAALEKQLKIARRAYNHVSI